MHTKQSSQIGTVLVQGGMDAALAHMVESLLGQCRERIVHRGEVDLQYTPPRTITPEIGSHVLPDMRPMLPIEFPKKKKKQPAPEAVPLVPPEHKRHEAPPAIENPAGENQRDGEDYTAGPYIEVNKDERTVSLNVNDERRHCVFPLAKNKADQIWSVSYQSESNRDEFLELKIVEHKSETIFRLRLNKLEQVTFVTDVEIDTTGSTPALKFSRKTGWVFDPQDAAAVYIDLTECQTETPP